MNTCSERCPSLCIFLECLCVITRLRCGKAGVSSCSIFSSPRRLYFETNVLFIVVDLGLLEDVIHTTWTVCMFLSSEICIVRVFLCVSKHEMCSLFTYACEYACVSYTLYICVCVSVHIHMHFACKQMQLCVYTCTYIHAIIMCIHINTWKRLLHSCQCRTSQYSPCCSTSNSKTWSK